MVSGTIEPMGTMLAGQTADAFYASIAHADLLAVGLNCATGPEFMTDHIRTLHEMASTRVSCYPNAGLPNEEGQVSGDAESLAAQLEKFVDHGWLNIVGGCCGTTPAHIKAIARDGRRQAAAGRCTPQRTAPTISGIDLVEADESQPAADRRRAHQRHRLAAVQEHGRRGEVGGGHRDRPLAGPERRAHHRRLPAEHATATRSNDIPPFYEKLIRKIKAPIMIDTTDPKAMELALTYCQGKSIINSINLEDGEEKFERICPARARRYGAALVVGCIDEDTLQAQAFTRERKLAVAERSVELLTEKYGIPPEDIIFDPLVFPCATGDENYIGGAVETIEGHPADQGEAAAREDRARHLEHLVRAAGCGARSRQLGLPVLLHQGRPRPGHRQCGEAGALRLDSRTGAAAGREPAVQYAAAEVRRSSECELRGAPEDWRAADRANRRPPSTSSTSRRSPSTSARRTSGKQKAADLPLDRAPGQLHHRRHQGRPDRRPRPKRAEGAAPLDIINGPLMAGMAEVGRLFNNNELIVAEVLQSAEAMKAAVNHLEQFMEKADTAARGKVRARHREGRRPRHRQESGRNHPCRTTATTSSISGSRCRRTC